MAHTPDGGFDLSTLDDATLRALIADALDVQRQRAAAAGGLEALCAQGFENGFDAKGYARTPIVVGDVLVCYGSIVERSAMRHECSFVRIGDTWVWEYDDVLRDEIRKLPARGREHQRSVSLVPAFEGLAYDLITCTMQHGVHQMRHTSSFEIRGGRSELVSTRSVKTDRIR